jgi:hypothetical protein
MKGFVTSCRLGLLVLGTTTLLSCQDNESMLFIRGAMYLQPGNCVLSPDAGATLLTNGVWDTAFGNSYGISLLVGNQLASKGLKTRARTETSNITLEGAEVSLRQPDGSLLRPTFTAPGAGYIEVGTGEDTGYGAMNIVAIPLSDANELIENDVVGGYTIAEIRVFGKTLGGQEVESGLFKFPITVCRGCLIRYPSASMGADKLCTASKEATTGPCRLGQDDEINCSLCAAKMDRCKDPTKNN